MILLDTSVVVASHREDHLAHGIAAPWFERLVEDGGRFGVPVGVWGSFLRIVTHRGVFDPPTPRDDAFAFAAAAVAQPAHHPLEPGPRHLELLRRVCDDADATGKLVPDAVLAAIALEHGATVATLDRDFARFSTVRHVRVGA